MITIRCTNPEKPVSHTLLVGKKYTIGRKGCEINFPDDQSISRNHAEIVVEHPRANMTDLLLTPTVVVTDFGSKFGTFANDGIERKSKMSMREALNFSPGDRFKFGLQWNEFKIEYIPLVVTPSAVKEPALSDLKKAVMILGGHMVQEWVPECGYVVMESLSLTVKVVCALLSAKYIVTPDFFQDMLQAVTNRKNLPDPNNFLPPVDETEKVSFDTVSFEPLQGRSTLFTNKIFVFCGMKHMRKMSQAVEAGGGICKQLTDVEIKDLLKKDYLLMKPYDRDLITAEQHMRSALDAYGKTKRLIQDSELGLAALYLSTQWHCNPHHTFTDELPKLPSPTQNVDSDTVIVPPTQDMETQLSAIPYPDSRKVVEETFVEDSDVKIKDEPLSDKLEGEPPSKKRPAAEELTRMGEKRIRPTPPPQTQKNTRSTAQRGLSAIFGLSDDEDEDEEVIIPASPSPTNMESATLDPHDEIDGNVAPGSPEMFDTDLTEPEVSVFKSPERRSTRSNARTSPQIPIEPQASTSRTRSGGTKRKNQPTPETSPVKIEPQQSVKKQRTKETKGSSENENLVQKAEQLSIKPDIKDILDDDAPPKHMEVHARLLKGPKIEPRIEVINGKTVKNFKSFKKILPLSMQQQNVSIASTSGSSSRSSRAGGTNTSTRSIKLTYEIFEYSPCMPYGKPERDDDATDEMLQRRPKTKGKGKGRAAARDDEREMDVDIDNIMPDTTGLPPDPSENQTSRRVTRGTKQQPTQEPPRAMERLSRQTTAKNKKIQQVILSDEDDDNDMFQF